jgi:hypothetical protein
MMLLRLRILTLTLAALVAGTLASCRSVSLADQRLLGRAVMQFGERGALAADSTLPGLTERGRALNSNAAGGGCASCY